MLPVGKFRKLKVVDPSSMVNTRTVPDALTPGGARPHGPGTRKEDWIASQLRRVYDEALQEAIPEDMLGLLDALDDAVPEESGPSESVLGDAGSENTADGNTLPTGGADVGRQDGR